MCINLLYIPITPCHVFRLPWAAYKALDHTITPLRSVLDSDIGLQTDTSMSSMFRYKYLCRGRQTPDLEAAAKDQVLIRLGVEHAAHLLWLGCAESTATDMRLRSALPGNSVYVSELRLIVTVISFSFVRTARHRVFVFPQVRVVYLY